MLREEVIKELNDRIKEINREKDIEQRIKLMITLLDSTRVKINDELDEIFSNVNLKKSKLNLSED